MAQENQVRILCREVQNLMDLYLADDPLLGPQERLRLEGHLQNCPQCRPAYDHGRHIVGLIRQHGQISEDTLALLAKARSHGVSSRPLLVRCMVRAGAVAACWAIVALGCWAISNRDVSTTRPGSRITSAREDAAIRIECAGNEGRMVPGSVIETSAGERRRLVLNGRHQVVMNAGTRLSIEPLRDRGSMGCMVNLALGEVYVHVGHDGLPFIVRTAHGRVVITGTTFDVQATEAGTALVVVEGSVRFESERGMVQVLAGQQSTIAGMSASPSTPTPCQSVALTTWARSTAPGEQIARDLRPDGFFWDDLPALPAQVQIDPDRIDAAQWTEQKRAWFQQQFPWIFELQAALAKEGMETDYPTLLLQSGDLWRFAYPQAAWGRQIEPDPNGLLRAAARYGRSEAWLQQQVWPFLRTAAHGQPTPTSEAFERWAKAVQAQASLCPPRADSGVFLDTVAACLYLAHTRTLAILAIRNGWKDPSSQVREEVLHLLQEELRTLAHCVELSHGLDLAKPNAGTCENPDRLNLLPGDIRKIGELERRRGEYEKVLHQ